MEETKIRPYHHGDLRRAIIEMALEMLAEEGGWQFTLREVARRVGVSHAAPYKHFPDKSALLAELVKQGYEQLGAAMRAAATPRPHSLMHEFQAAAVSYVQFGLANPALYRLMFSAAAGDPAKVHLDDRVKGTLAVVFDILQRGQQAGLFKQHPVQGQAAACWAMVHGITTLSIEGLLLPEKVGEKPFEAAMATLLQGLEA